MTRITVPAVGKLGVIADIPPQELAPGAWSNAINMRFRDGAAERFKGEKSIFDTPLQTPYYLQQYNANGKRWWIHCGLTGIYADDGVARQTITPAVTPTGAIDDRWAGGTLNGITVLNNGVDVPVYWGGTGLALPLPAWPTSPVTRAAVIRPYKFWLVALDITEGGVRFPHRVKWSSEADPGTLPSTWDETDVTQNAGELDLAEEPSLMVDQLTLGGANIIYKENAMFSMVPTGGTDIFRFTRLPGNEGALARGCIANTPMGHVVLTAGDVVLHSGQGPKSIITGRMRKYLFRSIDSNNRKRAFVTVNPLANEVWVCFPELGKAVCTQAVVWNWSDDVWTVRQLANVTYGATGQLDGTYLNRWMDQTDRWQDAAAAWNENELNNAQARLLTVSTSPSVTAVDVGATFNGAAYTSSMSHEMMAFDAPDAVKLCRAVYPRVDAAKGTRLQIEVGGCMDVEAGTTWSAPVTYTVGSTYKVDSFASGRFISIRIISLDNQPFRITSYDLDIVTTGGY